MARQVDVSVLVPVLNEASIIEESAKAMLAQSFDGEIEYLFLDGGSADETRQILERLAETEPRIKVSDNPARLQSPGLNIGLAKSQGEFVARMDAHSYYPSDYIARGVDRLRAGGVAWVGGPQLPLGVGRWSKRIALAMQSRLGIGGAVFRRPLTEEIETDTAFTGVWRRETLEDLGGWDEEAITNEDGELAARIRAQGGRIVCVPEMAAECITRDSIPALAKQYYRYGRGRVRTLRLHPDTMRTSHVLPPALVLVATGALAGPRRTVRPARLGLAAYLGALAVEAARISKRGGGEEARFVPLVLATMHASWGAGFLAGCAVHGLPVAALSGSGKPNGARVRVGRRLRHSGLRIAVYTDDEFSDYEGGIYARRAFTLFVDRLSERVDEMVVLGRLREGGEIAHYRLDDRIRFVGLPYYESLGSPLRAGRGFLSSMRSFWRALEGVDGCWLLGPHPFSLAFAVLAILRRKRIVLGVRQDLPEYARTRHPGRVGVMAVAWALEGAYRLLARRFATVVVGPALRHHYRHAGTLLEIAVSLVEEDQIVDPATAAERSYSGPSDDPQRRPGGRGEEPPDARRRARGSGRRRW